MKFETITQMDDNLIVASIFRNSNDPTNWNLGAYHLTKKITRDEGLVLKNKYGMKPFSSNGFSMGYKGEIPKSEFVGGKLMILEV